MPPLIIISFASKELGMIRCWYNLIDKDYGGHWLACLWGCWNTLPTQSCNNYLSSVRLWARNSTESTVKVHTLQDKLYSFINIYSIQTTLRVTVCEWGGRWFMREGEGGSKGERICLEQPTSSANVAKLQNENLVSTSPVMLKIENYNDINASSVQQPVLHVQQTSLITMCISSNSLHPHVPYPTMRRTSCQIFLQFPHASIVIIMHNISGKQASTHTLTPLVSHKWSVRLLQVDHKPNNSFDVYLW